eukprot:scaffold57228_cov19-Phaeocystis_antarctica.AAC.1
MPSTERSEWAKMRGFKRCIGDFEENSTSLEGRLDSSKSPRSNPAPCWRVPWKYQTVQGPWGSRLATLIPPKISTDVWVCCLLGINSQGRSQPPKAYCAARSALPRLERGGRQPPPILPPA